MFLEAFVIPGGFTLLFGPAGAWTGAGFGAWAIATAGVGGSVRWSELSL